MGNTAPKGKLQFKPQQFIDAIPGSGGIIAAIAKRVGCEWHTVQRNIENHPTVRQAYENECSGIDDLAESTVIKAIRDGDVGSAKWWLEKRRRDRFGNVTRLEGTDGGPIQVTITRKAEGTGADATPDN